MTILNVNIMLALTCSDKLLNHVSDLGHVYTCYITQSYHQKK